MFGLLRLIIFVAIAFVVGKFYERSNTAELCKELGGTMNSGLCFGAKQ